ncbi:MAG: hypothetical protein U0892_00530 [Pirellulales bacterium]
MPRLSIIIAHHTDERLETTLLSVLENRPADSEVIVAHDGSYRDPYQLKSEVMFVETNRGSSSVAKINEGFFAACAPVVHVLIDGARVGEGWCDGPLDMLRRSDLAAVSPAVMSDADQNDVVVGVAPFAGSRRELVAYTQAESADIAAPMLAAGFYSRKVLLTLGGWCEAVSSATADVVLGEELMRADADCDYDDSSVVVMPASLMHFEPTIQDMHDLAAFSVAAGIADASDKAAAGGGLLRWITNLFAPGKRVQSSAWNAGLRDARTISLIEDHLAASEKLKAARSQSSSNIGIYQPEPSDRSVASKHSRKAA